jgi:hypothetical protein
LGSDSSSARGQLASPLALALLLERLSFHITLLLLLLLEELGISLKLLSRRSCSYLNLLLLWLFMLTSPGLADLARRAESSTTVVRILALQVKTFEVLLAPFLSSRVSRRPSFFS